LDVAKFELAEIHSGLFSSFIFCAEEKFQIHGLNCKSQTNYHESKNNLKI